jgi:hypothetical protein
VLDGRALDDTAEALRIAEESGDNFTVGFALFGFEGHMALAAAMS